MSSSLLPLGSVQTALFKDVSGIIWCPEHTTSASFEIFRDGCCDLRSFLNSRTFDVRISEGRFSVLFTLCFYAVKAGGGGGIFPNKALTS